jgi:hypothetical protein
MFLALNMCRSVFRDVMQCSLVSIALQGITLLRTIIIIFTVKRTSYLIKHAAVQFMADGN